MGSACPWLAHSLLGSHVPKQVTGGNRGGRIKKTWQLQNALRSISQKEVTVLGLEGPAGVSRGDRAWVGGRGADVAAEVTGEILALWDHVLNSDCITGDF